MVRVLFELTPNPAVESCSLSEGCDAAKEKKCITCVSFIARRFVLHLMKFLTDENVPSVIKIYYKYLF